MFIANKETQDDLLDLHRGLHFVMDQMIRLKDYEAAERVIRQVDERMSALINKLQTPR